jgi:uncharacterized protein (TIGR02594 family)
VRELGLYAWLAKEPAPRVLVEAVRLFGVAEVEGNGDNPTILSWAKELGLKEYVHDETAWCGLFLALCVKRAGYPLSRAPLWALSWATWGTKSDVPKLGDVLVFERKVGRQMFGHTGLYVGEDPRAFHVYGGNQGNRVCVTRIARERLVAARRCKWAVGQPQNIRRIVLSAQGGLSEGEA